MSQSFSKFNTLLLILILVFLGYSYAEQRLIRECESEAYIEGFAHAVLKYRVNGELNCEYLTAERQESYAGQYANVPRQLEWTEKIWMPLEALKATSPRY